MKPRIQRFLDALVVIALILAGSPQLVAVELKGAPQATVEAEGVAVSWTTDTLCGTRFGYGTSPALLNKKAEGGVGLYHKVVLDDLKPGTTYHFSLGTSKHWLTSGTITLGGNGTLIFKPEGSESSTTSTTTAPPSSKPPASQPEKAKEETTPPAGPKPLPKLDGSGSTPAPKPAPQVEKTVQPTTTVKAPPTSKTWGYMGSLQDHYERHGQDFRCTSPDDYAAKAWMFLQYARKNGLPMKWDDSDGTLRIWEPKSRAFAAFNRDGTTKTFFRPNNPSYWSRQPGRPVKSSELPF